MPWCVAAHQRMFLMQSTSGIDEAKGLPLNSIVLLRNESSQSPVTEYLAEHIFEGFRL